MRRDRHSPAFSRRALLRGAAATPSLARTLAQPASRELLLIDSFVAGTPYHEADRLRGLLLAGLPPALRREPGNRRDRLAVEVLTREGAKLGYAPRGDNEAISRLLDGGRIVRARVAPLPQRAYGDVGMALRLVD
jgi:hypothetical protein